MGRRKTAVSEVYEELKERAKELALNIRVEKKKQKQCYKIGEKEE